MADLYKSQAWLRKRLLVDKKTPEEIAKECDVHHTTIYRQMEKFGLRKKKR